MLALPLVFIASFFGEIGFSISKYKEYKKELSIYEIIFLSSFATFTFFLLITLIIPSEYAFVGITSTFIFSSASLYTFSLRAILEILQQHLMASALIYAERSTFAFFHVLTLPLLLIVDMFIGYNLKNLEIIGILIIFITLLAVAECRER